MVLNIMDPWLSSSPPAASWPARENVTRKQNNNALKSIKNQIEMRMMCYIVGALHANSEEKVKKSKRVTKGSGICGSFKRHKGVEKGDKAFLENAVNSLHYFVQAKYQYPKRGRLAQTREGDI
jgi:hypothetical protein